MEQIKIELLKIITKKRLITITIIWLIGFLLQIMADTDLFTKNILQIKPISFSFIFILAMHLFYWTNKNMNSKSNMK